MKTLLLFFLLFISGIVLSQNQNTFKNGMYLIKSTTQSVSIDKIEVNDSYFKLINGNTVLEEYVVINNEGTQFHCEQYFADNVKRDKRKMTIEVLENNGNLVKIKVTNKGISHEMTLQSIN
jgi:tmRNA-binding protein